MAKTIRDKNTPIVGVMIVAEPLSMTGVREGVVDVG